MITAQDLKADKGLSIKTANCLVSEFDPIETMDDLVSRISECTEAELLRIPGIGRKALEETKDAFGLTFASDRRKVLAAELALETGMPGWQVASLARRAELNSAAELRDWISSAGVHGAAAKINKVAARRGYFSANSTERLIRWVFPDYDKERHSVAIGAAERSVAAAQERLKKAKARLAELKRSPPA